MLLFELLANYGLTSAPALYWFIFIHGGWVAVVIFFIYGAIIFWLEYRRSLYDRDRQFICLAIDVPKNTEQSPKAAEQIFATLAGAQSTPKWGDKWIKGEIPESFGLEIISLGGYVQFLIQTPANFRDLVEAAVYAQYPDAEINEVEDYPAWTKKIKFPSDEYELWGTEFSLAKKHFYPIKTYPEFEHPLSAELKDPIAPLLEVMSKLGSGEEVWLQIVITPAADSWKDPAMDLVKRLIGAEVKVKKNIFDWLVDVPLSFLFSFSEILGGGAGATAETKTSKLPSMMQHLSPGEKKAVEAIQNKTSKLGFYSRVRIVYLTKKEAFNKAHGNQAMMGAIKQFNTLDLNSFKHNRYKLIKAKGLFKKMRLNARKNRLLRIYRSRARYYSPKPFSNYMGYYGYVLNTEELATMFHFPVVTVKAPLLKKTEERKAEPPITLPVE